MSGTENIDPVSIGLPAIIPIGGDKKRIPGCRATEAEFHSIEGNKAIYRGVCNGRHGYIEEVLLNEEQIKEILQIVNGVVQIGEETSPADPLEEY